MNNTTCKQNFPKIKRIYFSLCEKEKRVISAAMASFYFEAEKKIGHVNWGYKWYKIKYLLLALFINSALAARHYPAKCVSSKIYMNIYTLILLPKIAKN